MFPRVRDAAAAIAAGCIACCIACSTQPAKDQTTPQRLPPPLNFGFYEQDGQRFDDAGTRGRVTVILIMTTYDLNSQVVAHRLNNLMHSFQPRINVGAIVLETANYAVLLEPFRHSLGLDYPVVLADQATLQGEGPFGSVAQVPLVLVLNAEGRPLWRVTGPATDKQLEMAVRRAESSVAQH